MKHSQRQISQRFLLFISYGTLTVFLLSLFMVYTYHYSRRNLITEAESKMSSLSSSVLKSTDDEMDKLATVSMNIVYSTAIREDFRKYSKTYAEEDGNPSAQVQANDTMNQLSEIITAIIGSYQSVTSIRLYDLNGTCVETSFANRTYHVDLNYQPWYDQVRRLAGSRYITRPRMDDRMPKTGNINESSYYISLIREFLDSNDDPEGIVEVSQDAGKIFSSADEATDENPCQVIIYNERGEQIYPYGVNERLTDYLTLAEKNKITDKKTAFVEDHSGNEELIARCDSEKYGWTVLAVEPADEVLKPLRQYTRTMIALTAFSMTAVLLICLYMASLISRPLVTLTNQSRQITLGKILNGSLPADAKPSHIKEIDDLSSSVQTMYSNLQESSKKVLMAQAEENVAKLRAAQSLINPHFLYNSLTNLSVMAEEGMNEEIVDMCDALCRYLRYISGKNVLFVTIKEELFNISQYLKCMSYRFGPDLEYTYTSDEQTDPVIIPKLIVQPIVENAFKYSFTGNPPWKIAITASVRDGHWTIRIEDNGGSLTDEKKEELLTEFRSIDTSRELDNMEIHHLGLKNVMLRLRMIYGEEAVFEIENSKSQTAFTIGGTINTKEELEHVYADF
ncbi:MAG: histidine kinase [Eubacteriales bacterium]|jgi:two-component system sensor histidine kinase YesM|nr:histidine kinase [Lachnospiraceae bacterium]MCH4064968.1 histidine kinase [Lachnospiraceae bacterium]MCH4103944.1 histidine kinase [Lachnospiraceae bacterium]MDD5859837.1 histidine kinase [Eubacteriales bacterium]